MRVQVVDESLGSDYDAFVAQHPKGHFLQTRAWGEVKRSMGWEPIPVVLLEDDRRITAAALILKRSLPRPLHDRCIFYSPRGPVCAPNDPVRLRALMDGIRPIAQSHHAIFLKIDPDIPVSDHQFESQISAMGLVRTVSAQGFEGVQPTFVFRLDIKPEEAELLAHLSNKTRYNLRLAEKKGVTIRNSKEKDDLRAFYGILIETAERDRFLVRSYDYYEQIWNHFVVHDLAALFVAEFEGRPVAATLAFILGEKAWYLYGASSNRHRNVMPNYLLQWTMIRWAKARGCTLYDFRGVSGDLSEDNPLYGLYRFKKGFGGDFVQFIGEWDLIYAPILYLLWTRALPLYSRTVRRIIRWKKGRDEKGGSSF
ncbi:MAG: lipid II:glycine glycyltransferase FemX [Solirubrobacterales bacterium]